MTRWAAVESALDLVRTLAAEDPELRGSLPLGVDLADPDTVRDDVAAVIEGLQRAGSAGWTRPRWPTGCAAHLGAGPAGAGGPAGPVGRGRRAHRRHGAAAAPAAAAAPSGTARTGGSRCSPDGGPTPSRRRPRAALTALLAAGELTVGDLPGLDAADG